MPLSLMLICMTLIAFLIWVSVAGLWIIAHLLLTIGLVILVLVTIYVLLTGDKD